MSGVEPAAVEPLGKRAARDLTVRIKLQFADFTSAFVQLRELLVEAYHGQAWKALGYPSWQAYFEENFRHGDHPKLTAEDRWEIVAWLSEEGLSARAIAPVVGVSPMTVSRDRAAGVPPGTPERQITGQDGKTYTKILRVVRPEPDPSKSDEELVAEHLGLYRKRERPTRARTPAAIIEELARIRTELRRIVQDAQDVTIDWRPEWRAGIAEDLHGISRMADMVAGVVESGSASFEEGLRQLLDGDGDPGAS